MKITRLQKLVCFAPRGLVTKNVQHCRCKGMCGGLGYKANVGAFSIDLGNSIVWPISKYE